MKKLFYILVIIIGGTNYIFSQNTTPNQERNIISINYLNLVNSNLHLQYERILRNPIFGVKFSVNIGITDLGTDILPYYRKFTTGADFNIYPAGQGRVKYFVGPAFRTGVVTEEFANSFSSANIDYNYYSFLFSNGFHIQPGKSFYMSFQAAVGIGFFKARNENQIQT